MVFMLVILYFLYPVLHSASSTPANQNLSDYATQTQIDSQLSFHQYVLSIKPDNPDKLFEVFVLIVDTDTIVVNAKLGYGGYNSWAISAAASLYFRFNVSCWRYNKFSFLGIIRGAIFSHAPSFDEYER